MKLRLSTSFKSNFGLFKRQKMSSQCIASNLTSPKCDLGDFEKVMFQMVSRPCEIIFCLLTSTKCDLGEDEKAIFQVVNRQ